MQETRKWIPISIVVLIVCLAYTVWLLRGRIASYVARRRANSYEQEPLLSGTFQIDKQISFGHYGRIYSGTYNKQQVCFKMISNGKIFEKEHHIMTKLRNHENIVHLIGSVASEKPSSPYLIMHLFTKGDLSRFLSADGQEHSDIFKIDAINDILKGMKFVHENDIWHLDLAARNCLVTDQGRIKIGDFGNASFAKRGKKNLPSKVNYRWMPPEVLRKQTITWKTDVWSFGIVVHEICHAGKLPWQDLPILEDLPKAAEIMENEPLPGSNLNSEVDQMMKSCLAKLKKRPSFHKLAPLPLPK